MSGAVVLQIRVSLCLLHKQHILHSLSCSVLDTTCIIVAEAATDTEAELKMMRAIAKFLLTT